MRKHLKLSLAPLASLLIAIASSGCASAPVPSSPDDCLVIVKSDFINSTTVYSYRSYSLELSTGEKPIGLPVGKSSYVAIIVNSPAVIIDSISSCVRDYNMSGNSSRQKAGIPLPYKAGCAIVADFCFVQEMKYGDDEHSLLSSFNVRKVEQQEKDDLLQSLKDAKKLEAWSL